MAAWFLLETNAGLLGGLRVVVVLAGQDVLEAGRGLDGGHTLDRVVDEYLGHLHLVLFQGLVRSEDSKDVLGGPVILQQLLHVPCHSIVLEVAVPEVAALEGQYPLGRGQRPCLAAAQSSCITGGISRDKAGSLVQGA